MVKNWFRKHLALVLTLTFVFPALTSDGAVILFQRTQEAIDTPFEPGRNPDFNGGLSTFTSEDVQNAIEEAYHTAPGTASRFAVIYGLQGNKSNTWLYLFNNIPSDDSPFVVAEPGTVKALSVANKSSGGTTVYTVYKNGAILTTLTRLPGSTTAFISGLTLPIIAGDTFSVKITSGSSNDTAFSIFFQTTI